MTIKRRGLHLLMVLLLLTMAMPSLAQGRKVKPAGNIQSKKVSSTQVGLFCHPWQGRRVAYFGDSITDPRNEASDKKYWSLLQDWLGIEPFVYGISGRQWNDIPRQAEQLKKEHGEEFDAIIIFIGTNDFNAAVPVGEWYVETEDSVLVAVHKPKEVVLRCHRQPSMNKDTYRGRINIAMRKIKELFPKKQVVLTTPIHRGLFDRSNTNIQPTEAYQNACGEWVDAYVQSVKQAGNIWSVPVIDLNASCGLFPLVAQQLVHFNDASVDQLHPNNSGHLRMARTMMYQLLTLPCVFE